MQNELGQVIKERRQELGYTQDELAELSGVSKSTIGRIERGNLSPKVEYLTKISEVLFDNNFYIQVTGDIVGGFKSQKLKENLNKNLRGTIFSFLEYKFGLTTNSNSGKTKNNNSFTILENKEKNKKYAVENKALNEFVNGAEGILEYYIDSNFKIIELTNKLNEFPSEFFEDTED